MKHNKVIQNEKGVTLIELLLSVAIFGIVMVSLFSFMTIISRQYSKANNEINVQNEVQTLTTHLQNLITSADTNIGISGDKLFMIDDSYFEVIEYDAAKEYIYYYSVTQLSVPDDEMDDYKNLDDRDDKLNKAISIVAAHPITSIEDNLSTYLMTEYVSEFTISPNLTDNYVAINITLTRDRVSYSAAKNIYLRNKLYEIETSGISSTPTKAVTPTPTPGGSPTPTPTPGGSSTPTPTPGGSFTPTPTPGDSSTPTPTPSAVTITGITAVYNAGKAYEGEILNKSDFTVTLQYSDGTTVVTSDWTTNDNMTVGAYQSSKTVNIQSNGYGAAVTISVAQISSLEVTYIGGTKKPGETISRGDFEVYNVYSDNHKIRTDYWSCNPDNVIGASLAVGTYSLSIGSSLHYVTPVNVSVPVEMDLGGYTEVASYSQSDIVGNSIDVSNGDVIIVKMKNLTGGFNTIIDGSYSWVGVSGSTYTLTVEIGRAHV